MSGREDREGAPTSYASSTPFRPAKTDPLLQRAIPVAKELPGYRTPTARRDVLAGVTVAALAIPSAMAYAELAGLPAEAGLYALLLPTVAGITCPGCTQSSMTTSARSAKRTSAGTSMAWSVAARAGRRTSPAGAARPDPREPLAFDRGRRRRRPGGRGGQARTASMRAGST